VNLGTLNLSSYDLYMIIKEKISVMISVDRWLSSYNYKKLLTVSLDSGKLAGNYSGTKWQRYIGTKQIRVVSLFFPSLCLWYSVPLRLPE